MWDPVRYYNMPLATDIIIIKPKINNAKFMVI